MSSATHVLIPALGKHTLTPTDHNQYDRKPRARDKTTENAVDSAELATRRRVEVKD